MLWGQLARMLWGQLARKKGCKEKGKQLVCHARLGVYECACQVCERGFAGLGRFGAQCLRASCERNPFSACMHPAHARAAHTRAAAPLQSPHIKPAVRCASSVVCLWEGCNQTGRAGRRRRGLARQTRQPGGLYLDTPRGVPVGVCLRPHAGGEGLTGHAQRLWERGGSDGQEGTAQIEGGRGVATAQ